MFDFVLLFMLLLLVVVVVMVVVVLLFWLLSLHRSRVPVCESTESSIPDFTRNVTQSKFILKYILPR